MEGHRVIKLSLKEAQDIDAEWRELNKNYSKKDDAYFVKAGEILEKELKMYKSKLASLSDEEKKDLTADLLTHQQKTDLDEIRKYISEKNTVSPIDQKFNDLLSSISQQRSKLGGRKSNKRSRSRSQNKRYSRRRSNVGKRRQYSSRRK